jgi:tetrapyrrole methylase family protein/MazG family protein
MSDLLHTKHNTEEYLTTGGITIVGLGPGSFQLLTVETWDLLRSSKSIYLRTAKHPTVDELRARSVAFSSYDSFYEEKANFDEVYQSISADIVARAVKGEQVIYAVPGSPLVAERTVGIIRQLAAEQQVAVRIVPGMSFLEVLYTRLGIDPISGITVLDSADVDQLPRDINTALIVTQVYNGQVASEAKLALMELFPDDYEVLLIRNLSLVDEEIRPIALYELDRQGDIDHLTSLFVPARVRVASSFSLDPLTAVMARLRSPDGCVWDLEQTHTSLRRYIVEEVYEVLEAVDNKDAAALCEELGDVLLQLVFHARIAEECGAFTMQDVIDEVTAKMIRRHPHVFGNITVQDAAEVVLNWDQIKQQEKGAERKSVLDGVSPGLPSLMRSYKLQAKAAKVGFDWNNIGPVWDKLMEEWQELQEAVTVGDKEAIEGEFGDLLFAAVNLARFLQIEPETALNRTNNKFISRFSYIESKVRQQKLAWRDLNLDKLDEFWNEAKALERKKQ